MQKIGYTTGTFDILHEGHIALLEAAKKLCAFLIVGLTTDELAKKQKRETWFDYRHRSRLLSALHCVDLVVEHTGVTKQEAYNRLGFEILFIGDDYLYSDEYSVFAHANPWVKVIYLPKVGQHSTSSIIQRFNFKMLNGMTIIRNGMGGPIVQVSTDVQPVVIKPVAVGFTELLSYDGSDSYKVTDHSLPRNWKGLNLEKKFPMIAGVNAYREVYITDIIKNCEWCSFLFHRIALENPKGNISSSLDPVDRLVYERQNPTRIIWIYQKHCGVTLKEYISRLTKKVPIEQVKSEFKRIVDKLYEYILQLIDLGIVHGDIHPENICVADSGQIYIVDFGWCMYHGFCMSDFEREFYYQCLYNKFDFQHFQNSLREFELDKLLDS